VKGVALTRPHHLVRDDSRRDRRWHRSKIGGLYPQSGGAICVGSSATMRPRPRNVKLRLFILVVLAAALLTANASAGLQLQTKVRKGVKTSSRSASGSCGFKNNFNGLDDLLLFCDGWNGRAKARYDFYLPEGLYGTPSMHVYGNKLCCSSSTIKKRLAFIEEGHYRIVVSVTNPTRFDLRSVSLSYYVQT
jgi:hypothetical protein